MSARNGLLWTPTPETWILAASANDRRVQRGLEGMAQEVPITDGHMEGIHWMTKAAKS